MPGEVEKKYNGILEKKWTAVLRLQKRVRAHWISLYYPVICLLLSSIALTPGIGTSAIGKRS